ncbi:MAG: TIGR02680 family protein, partial [Acidimicrobiales bacterium]
MTDQLFGVPQPAGATAAPDDGPPERLGRWVLHRAGILNVWQYDRVELRFAGGRVLLRGKNGAGKSKALEVLLPFLLDGDTRTIDAAGRDRTTVGWLMTDGREPGNHLGYVWLELRSSDEDGHDRFCTVGAGLKSSSATRQTATWYFLVEDVRVGAGLALEDDGECLSLERLKAQLGEQVTTSAAEHRRRVAHRLFGLRDEARYANLLHLLHRLRDPNIGNRIEAGELAAVLRDALPPPSDTSLEVGAERFDTLEQIREQLERTQRTATALGRFMVSYVGYARTVLRGRAEAVLDAVRQHRRAEREAAAREAETAEANLRRDDADAEVRRLRDEESAAAAELDGLQQSDAYKQHLQLVDRRKAVQAADHAAVVAESSAELARRGLREAGADLAVARTRADTAVAELVAARAPMLRHAVGAGVDGAVIPEAPDASTGEAELAATRSGVVAALDVARGRRRQVDVVRRLAGASLDARRAAATADQQADRSERELADRVAEEDQGRAAWVATSQEWRDEVRVWPAGADELGVEWSPLRAVLRDGPAGSAELDLAASTAATLLAPHRDAARAAEASAASARASAAAALEAKEAERAALEATEEARPEAGRYRSARRDPAQGAPLYELVDFRPEVADDTRAGLEAAIEASGLLDAWVGADGLVTHPATQDVLLRPGLAALPAGTADLREVLVAAVADGSPVGASTVTAVLAAIGLGRVGPGGAAPGAGEPGGAGPGAEGEHAWVAADGRWSLGPLHGAWSKARGEYLGAGTRRATRERRLAAMALECDERRSDLLAADAVHETSRAHRERLDQLPDTFPSGQEVAAAAREVALLARVAGDARARHDDDRRLAEQSRIAAARAVAELQQAAATDNLPVELDALDGVAAAARELAEALEQWERHLEDLSYRVREAAERAQRLADRHHESDEASARARQLRDAHRQEAAMLDALEGAIGATIDEVLAAIESATHRRDAARDAGPPAEERARAFVREAVRCEERAARAVEDVADAAGAVRVAAARLDTALLLPGAARAALGRDLVQTDELLEGGTPGAPGRTPG